VRRVWPKDRIFLQINNTYEGYMDTVAAAGAPLRASNLVIAPRRVAPVTIIVPAYNEAASISDTILSLQCQTVQPAEIIVVDDGSTDGTGDIAQSLGVTVLRPPKNTGSKAGAQTFALGQVETAFVMAIDADTILAPDAVEKILPSIEQDPSVAAACGFVLPRFVRTIWERGRYIEYMFAFSFFKQVQDYFDRPLISSGCFSIYRTPELKALGGWSNRTMAEDMDLTWSMYQAGLGVRFVPEALSYPIEPENYHFMRAQLRRWSHGFVQNVRLHWRGLLQQPYLRTMVSVALWDGTVAAFLYLIGIPLLAITLGPIVLIAYVVDLPAVAVPTIVKGVQRGELGKVLLSLPFFFVLRLVNSVFLLRALWSEFVVGRTLLVYEKGH
jgi:cellulose synthase/poly-beta-1,6-N-acetylglucosamine synthase-like glycosyltransferase